MFGYLVGLIQQYHHLKQCCGLAGRGHVLLALQGTPPVSDCLVWATAVYPFLQLHLWQP